LSARAEISGPFLAGTRARTTAVGAAGNAGRWDHKRQEIGGRGRGTGTVAWVAPAQGWEDEHSPRRCSDTKAGEVPPGEQLALGSGVALECVRDEHPRDIRKPCEELAKELRRGPLLPAALPQAIEHGPGLIHCPPQLARVSFNRKTPFLEMPFLA
jgi:hypothetical protein